MYRGTWVEINLDSIYHNVSEIKKYTGYDKLYAVVKANAYGHGDIEVAQTALEAGATHLAVAFLDEAVRLRKYFDCPILVLGYTEEKYFDIASENNISLTITHDINYDKPLNVHIKVDTGMNRLGMKSPMEFHKLVKKVTESNNLTLEGIFTHLATAGSNDDYYESQIEELKEFEIDHEFIHVNNSAGMLAYKNNFNAGRLGIAMYGLTPYEGQLPVELKQAFSLHAKITNVKQIFTGESVGYGATYTAEKDEYIATIAIGYADGWIRAHRGCDVSINGKRYKSVGTICMDQMMIKVDETVQLGDVVSLINDDITVDEVADRMDTINYEVTCSISDRVPRLFKRNGKVIKEQNYRF